MEAQQEVSTNAEPTKLRLRIMQDSDVENTREWDNLGTMVCWHRRYILGDVRPSESPQDWREAFDAENPDAIVLPLWLIDHGGISISTRDFSDPWDSGQVGWIYLTRARAHVDLFGEYPRNEGWQEWTAEIQKQTEQALRSEVETYDSYLRGDCWYFVLDRVVSCKTCGHVEYETIDSCGGFLGKGADEGIVEHLPKEARALFSAAWERRYDTK